MMRALLAAFALLSSLVAGPALAAPSESVHDLDWFVHVDLVTLTEDLPFWTALIVDRLAEADVLIQGHQGPADNGCCVVLDAVSVSTFGSPGDGLDVITTQGELNTVVALGAGAYLVDMIHYCNNTFSTGIRGCAQTPGDVLVVGFEADATNFLAPVTAHERGHNAGLDHVTANPCELMSASNGGGCLSVSECSALIADADGSGGSCECLPDTLGNPPLSTSNTCTDTSGCGICGGGVCGACNGLGNVRLMASGGPGASSGATPNDPLELAGASSHWSDLGSIGVEVSGLAYDRANQVLYGIEVLAGDDALITLDPLTGVKTGTVGTLTGKADVISLAFDPDAGGDRLFAIEIDDDLFGMFTCLVDVGISPPCFSELFVIDPSDASISVLGELNSAITTDGYSGMAWDDDNAELYVAGPPGMRSVDLASCNGSSCPTIGAVDTIFRSSASLAWDSTTGLLIRGGSLFDGTMIDHHDPATGETRPSRGIDVYTPGGLAALPEPGVTSGLGAGILLLVWLKRRRDRSVG